MNTPIMPSGLKTQLRIAFRTGDIDNIVTLNQVWYGHVKHLRAEAKKQAEKENTTN